jgi:CRP-like cAMP-binding protein
MLIQEHSAEIRDHFRPHQYIARENDARDFVYRIDEGWACRFRLLADGRRQITMLFLPGDLCDPHWILGRPAREPTVALTNVRASRLSISRQPELQKGLWPALMDIVDRQNAWIVSLGRKTAIERLSHMFCDVFERMRNCGMVHGDQCAMPLTQMDIADLTGLTSVHVNRTLKTMRARGLIELHSKWLRIPDLQALRQSALLPLTSADVVPLPSR